MASTMSSNAQSTLTPQADSNSRPNAPNAAGSGRGHGRGGQMANSRGRGRGRGRGDRHNGRPRPERPAPPRPPPDDRGGGVSGTPSRDAASVRAGDTLQENGTEGQNIATLQAKGKQQEEEVEAEVCFICATPVVHNSVAPCNHRTCHICALRLRALYKTRACAHCRTEAPYLIFTDDATKRFEDFTDADMKHTDETLGIKYTDNEIHSDTVLLLRYNCPDQQCDVACLGWPHLHHHVKGTHHKIMCDLCTRNKKVFTHEHELFTPQELRKHEKFGDDNPGAVDQSGFKGHPECGFCKKRFYGDDELYTHCRERHERCHICDRRRQGGQQQYFLDYDSLEQHFKKDHFLCPDRECLDKKFVVFESEMDMKAHQLEMHPNGLTKDARRDARRVDISTFDYREPHREPRRGGRAEREGHRPGRGRDPNTDPLPQSTAQPLRRDELAYQRQLAIASTQGPPVTSSPNRSPRPGHAQPVNAPNTAFSALSLDPQTPQQQARQIAHEALISRASALLGHDAGKLASFRSSVSTYQRSAADSAASDLITTFFSLFDVPASTLGSLIHDLAELYENEKKREGLLKAWTEWRAINEDYPSLPAGGGSTGDGAGLGGATGAASVRRVLKLKSSTAGSARGAQQQQASSNAGTARGWPAPGAASARGPAISNTGSIAKVGTTTPWASGSRSSNTVGPAAAAARPISKGNPSAGPKPNTAADNFPALPAAKKPNVLIAGLTRGTVRPSWETAGPSVGSAWGGGGSSNGITVNGVEGAAGGDASETAGGGNAKKKGNKGRNKGEVLYKFG